MHQRAHFGGSIFFDFFKTKIHSVRVGLHFKAFRSVIGSSWSKIFPNFKSLGQKIKNRFFEAFCRLKQKSLKWS